MSADRAAHKGEDIGRLSGVETLWQAREYVVVDNSSFGLGKGGIQKHFSGAQPSLQKPLGAAALDKGCGYLWWVWLCVMGVALHWGCGLTISDLQLCLGHDAASHRQGLADVVAGVGALHSRDGELPTGGHREAAVCLLGHAGKQEILEEKRRKESDMCAHISHGCMYATHPYRHIYTTHGEPALTVNYRTNTVPLKPVLALTGCLLSLPPRATLKVTGIGITVMRNTRQSEWNGLLLMEAGPSIPFLQIPVLVSVPLPACAPPPRFSLRTLKFDSKWSNSR